MNSNVTRLAERLLFRPHSGAQDRRVARYIWSAKWLREEEPAIAAGMDKSLYDLMVLAGNAVYGSCRRAYGEAKKWLILAGTGNNGGDAYEVARSALKTGYDVSLFEMPARHALPPEATEARARWIAAGGTCTPVQPDTIFPSEVHLVVDGLLGTGVNGAPSAAYADVIRRVNALPAPRVAIDIPSGLNAETGIAAGECIRADMTVTVIALKPGLFLGHARAYTGLVVYDPLTDAAKLTDPARLQHALLCRLDWHNLGDYFGVRRPILAHKGHNGRTLLIGGDLGYGGAIAMATEAAVSAGSGLTSVWTVMEHVPVVLTRCPEAMVTGLRHDDTTTTAASAAATTTPAGTGGLMSDDALLERMQAATVIAIGPGLGRGLFGKRLMQLFLRCAAANPAMLCVLDADALNALAEVPVEQRPTLANSVITPHLGEAARLLRCTVAEVEADTLVAAQRLAALLGGVCVLKGAGSLVYRHHDDGAMTTTTTQSLYQHAAFVDAGNAGMATGGMGDVLTGVLAAMLAQWPRRLFDAVCAGVLTHAVAADMVAAETCDMHRGLRPTDLFSRIQYCVNSARADEPTGLQLRALDTTENGLAS